MGEILEQELKKLVGESEAKEILKKLITTIQREPLKAKSKLKLVKSFL